MQLKPGGPPSKNTFSSINANYVALGYNYIITIENGGLLSRIYFMKRVIMKVGVVSFFS